MTDPLSPPPWRPIPTAVRDRILNATAEPVVQRRRPLVGVAAGLVVLAVGAVFTVQSTVGPDQAIDVNPGLDRCAAAAHEPDRGQWEQVFKTTFVDFAVIAIRAGGKPVFCELTPTAVTVSTAEPAYVSGGLTGMVMNTALGTIGGVADPSWREVWIRTGDSVRPAVVVDGLFVAGFGAGHTAIGIAGSDRPAQWTTLPLPTQPPITVVDARQGPAPDRSTGRGRILDDCIKAAGKVQGVIDPDSWEPGAMVQSGDGIYILARNAYGYSSCSYSTSAPVYGTFGGRGYYEAGKDASRGPAPKAFSAHGEARTGQILIKGVVPAECRRVQIIIDGNVTAEADVANSTFAALLPPGSVRGPSDPRLTYRLYDTTGKITYEGP